MSQNIVGDIDSKICPNKESCPYLNFENPEKVLAERDYLRGRVDEMEITFNLAIEKIKSQDKEIASLKEENTALKAEAKEERKKIYKPAKKEKKLGKPGAPFGHPGITREKPKEPDQTVRVHLKHCPHCKGRVKRICGKNSFSDHIQEDIIIIRFNTLFRHYKYWCPKCEEIVQGIGEGEIPRSYLGPNAILISNLIHYEIGIPYEKIEGIYTDIFGLPLTTGTLIGMDKKVAEKGVPLYAELERKIKSSSVSYTDETGWPINGDPHWLWHAGNKEASLYVVDKHRSHEVAEKILGKNYKGVIVSDCLGAYNLVNALAKQKCIAHILRDLDKLTETYPDDLEVIAFSVNLDNILHEGLVLWKDYRRKKYTLADLKKGKEDLEGKIDALTRVKIANKKANTLRKRLILHRNELFTYLDYPDIVEPTNNFAERQLRSSVISRKLSFGNKTKAGADRHAVMMSLIQTAKLQGKNPKDLLLSLILGSPEIRAPTS